MLLINLNLNFNIIEELYTSIALGAQLYFVYRWTLSRIEHYKATQLFLQQLRTNHLNHIYHTLRLICEKLDIKYTEPPDLP